MADLRDLYEEVILDHNRSPRNFLKKPPGANRRAYGFNPLCGDEFTVYLVIEDGVVKDVGFDGAGCAISTASASLMTEAIKGKTEAYARALFEGVHNLLTQQQEMPELGKLTVLAGVHAYPTRVKCATLAWHTLQAALENRQTETITTE
jgi:nitrogen fixation protein NifU and related proteins